MYYSRLAPCSGSTLHPLRLNLQSENNKVANLSQQARHELIVELVNAKGFVSIDDLAVHFDVTPQTMRRDINTLATENRVRRFHGGASAAPSTQDPKNT